jgi:prepilin-type N-terminal cleavage/methylation domain-containing protein
VENRDVDLEPVAPSRRGRELTYRACDRDDGFTMVEVLVTIVILGILFAAVLGGLATLVTSSALHRRQADVGAVVRSAAEAVNAAPYEPCATATYSAALNGTSHPSNVGAPTLVAVTKIDGTACSSDPGMQMVQVQAVSTDGKTSERLWVVKANR